jgi:molybdate transport system substrate-binding protein
VIYPVAVIKTTKDPAAARAFEDFLSGPQGRAIFEKYGFSLASP